MTLNNIVVPSDADGSTDKMRNWISERYFGFIYDIVRVGVEDKIRESFKELIDELSCTVELDCFHADSHVTLLKRGREKL